MPLVFIFLCSREKASIAKAQSAIPRTVWRPLQLTHSYVPSRKMKYFPFSTHELSH